MFEDHWYEHSTSQDLPPQATLNLRRSDSIKRQSLESPRSSGVLKCSLIHTIPPLLILATRRECVSGRSQNHQVERYQKYPSPAYPVEHSHIATSPSCSVVLRKMVGSSTYRPYMWFQARARYSEDQNPKMT